MGNIYYIGDSTVARNSIHTYPQTGMSQALQLYIPEEIRIFSHAKNGRSTKSFLEEGLFEPVLLAMQPGDYLLIQFGHNDEKPDPARHTDPDTTFSENLRFFIRSARNAGAYPLLITPIARRLFDGNGRFLPGSHGQYPEAVRRVGEQTGTPVADLTKLTEEYLCALGDGESKRLFMWPKDNTHLKPEGAVVMAGFLTGEMKRLGDPWASLVAEPDFSL